MISDMKMPGSDGLWLLESFREQLPRHLGDHAHRLRRHRGRGGLPAPRRGRLPAQAAQAHRPHPRHRARAGQAPHRAGAQALPEEARAQGARPHHRAAHRAPEHRRTRTRTRCSRWWRRSTPASTRPATTRSGWSSTPAPSPSGWASAARSWRRSAAARCCTTSGRSACRTRCCSSPASSRPTSGWRCASIRTSATT